MSVREGSLFLLLKPPGVAVRVEDGSLKFRGRCDQGSTPPGDSASGIADCAIGVTPKFIGVIASIPTGAPLSPNVVMSFNEAFF
jgi:hypothetical protein